MLAQIKVAESCLNAGETLSAGMDLLPKPWFDDILDRLNAKRHESNGHAKKKPGRKAKAKLLPGDIPIQTTEGLIAFRPTKPRKKAAKKVKAETNGESLPNVRDGIQALLAANGEGLNAGVIIAGLSGKVATKSDKPANVVRSTLGALLRKGVLRRKGKLYQLKAEK